MAPRPLTSRYFPAAWRMKQIHMLNARDRRASRKINVLGWRFLYTGRPTGFPTSGLRAKFAIKCGRSHHPARERNLH
jgi:hypothetical protein